MTLQVPGEQGTIQRNFDGLCNTASEWPFGVGSFVAGLGVFFPLRFMVDKKENVGLGHSWPSISRQKKTSDTMIMIAEYKGDH